MVSREGVPITVITVPICSACLNSHIKNGPALSYIYYYFERFDPKRKPDKSSMAFAMIFSYPYNSCDKSFLCKSFCCAIQTNLTFAIMSFTHLHLIKSLVTVLNCSFLYFCACLSLFYSLPLAGYSRSTSNRKL